jgi:hypothetical protein
VSLDEWKGFVVKYLKEMKTRPEEEVIKEQEGDQSEAPSPQNTKPKI